MSRAPVVELSSSVPASRKPKAVGRARLMTELERMAHARLEGLLVSLFNNTDDALFERADRSRSDHDQQMFFEAMRHLRLSRATVLRAFHAALSKAFAQINEPPSATADAADAPDFEAMSLLQKDELEISVAISGIVSKVTSQYSLPIMQLTRRLDHINPAREITESCNPLGPRALSECFSSALADVDVDITVRIILFKLFERFVMEQLGELYQEVNAYLAGAGVLPDLKLPFREMRRSPARGADARGADARGADALGADARVADVLHAGVTGDHSGSGSAPGNGHAGGGATSYGFAAEFSAIQQLLASAQGRVHVSDKHTHQGPQLSTGQLLDVLGALQSSTPVTAAPSGNAPLAVDLSALLAGRAQQITGSAAASLRQADDDVVNFVGMLFDYILNDRNLAIPMKALIARLQIPIVKLAIMDKNFFAQARHPARRLLNELSSAGIGWSGASELRRDALYTKIESVVARVLNDFQGNPDIFDSLTRELLDFVDKDRRRTDIVEQRLRETEIGKAKTTEAKLVAQNVINQKAAGLRLHPMIGRFISETWSKVLVFVGVKYGSNSSAWMDAVTRLDDLLWSVQPLNTLEDVQRREAEQETLLTALRDGMLLINTPDEDISDALQSLRAHLGEISEHDRAFLIQDAPRSGVDQEEEREVIKEVQLAEVVEEHPVEVLPEPQHLQVVDKLSEGSWVEIRSKGSDPLRCKLATIVGNGNRYVFVNRRGMKVAERSRLQLAEGVSSGEVIPLDESEVFDKALEAVIGNLRQLRGRPAKID